MYRPLGLAVALVFGGVVSIAVADEARQDVADPAAMFAALDKNHDGQLTVEEVPAEQRRLFERLLRIADKNHDGQLTAEEFAEGLKPRERPQPPAGGVDGRGDRFFKRLDANGDGKVTLDEVPEERREGFKRLIARGDKDGDGALNEQEMAAAMSGAATAPEKPAKGAEAASPAGRPDPRQLFSRLDQNSDGKVTLDEVPEERREQFERLIEFGDKDGDGALSEKEFTAAMARIAGAGGKPNPANAEASKGPDAARAKQLFARLDKNGDGKLTLDEVPEERQGLRRLVTRGDKDGDKALSFEEFVAISRQAANGKPPKK